MSLTAPTLEERLNNIIRVLLAPDANDLMLNIVPFSKLPMDYLNGLSIDDRTIALRAPLVSWAVTAGTQVARKMQLKATLASCNGKYSMVNTGTGSGKTLPIVLNLLLDNPRDCGITITISPLKRLQITQENDFNIEVWDSNVSNQ